MVAAAYNQHTEYLKQLSSISTMLKEESFLDSSSSILLIMGIGIFGGIGGACLFQKIKIPVPMGILDLKTVRKMVNKKLVSA